MDRILLAVDLSYQVYRASAAHPHLTDGHTFTGGLYGFFMTLTKMIRETQATHLIVCADRKPYLRSKSYPDYKQLRRAKRNDGLLESFLTSMKLVNEVLPAIGLPIWGVDGFESDDLIAHCATRYRHRFKRVYAASNDSDLYQLLWIPNFSIYTKGINQLITGAKLLEKHQLTPAQYMLMTALTGTHNDIAGIVGVGDVTAKKAVLDPALMRNLRANHADVINRNLKLIQLPHRLLPTSLPLPFGLDVKEFERRDLYRCLGKYSIETTSGMVEALEQVNKRHQ